MQKDAKGSFLRLCEWLKRMRSHHFDNLCSNLRATQAAGFNRICKVLHLCCEWVRKKGDPSPA